MDTEMLKMYEDETVYLNINTSLRIYSSYRHM